MRLTISKLVSKKVLLNKLSMLALLDTTFFFCPIDFLFKSNIMNELENTDVENQRDDGGKTACYVL